MSEPAVRWDERGLVPAIVQDDRTAEVLMMAWMDPDALALTTTTGQVHFWSRSRKALWKKGETSGNTLEMVGLAADCDGDTLVVRVRPAGPACHTGSRTCFTGPDGPPPEGFAELEKLWATIISRTASAPPGSYTARLMRGGPAATGRKLIEEAAELVEAALHHERGGAADRRVAEEAADLVYHLMVSLAERGVDATDVLTVLSSRSVPDGGS